MLKNEYLFFKAHYKKSFFLILFIGLLVGLLVYYIGLDFEEFVRKQANSIAESMDDSSGLVPTPFQDFLSILKNNLSVGMIIIIMGILPIYGLPFLYGLFVFAAVGVMMSFGTIMGFDVVKMALVAFVPHAIIEVIPICYSVAIGMYVNKNVVNILFFRKKQTSKITITLLRSLKSYLLIVVPLFFLAALVEAYITRFFSSIFL